MVIFLKNTFAKFSSVGDSSDFLSTKILLAVFQIAFQFYSLWLIAYWFIGCRFDDLSFRQENIRSTFSALNNVFRKDEYPLMIKIGKVVLLLKKEVQNKL